MISIFMHQYEFTFPSFLSFQILNNSTNKYVIVIFIIYLVYCLVTISSMKCSNEKGVFKKETIQIISTQVKKIHLKIL